MTSLSPKWTNGGALPWAPGSQILAFQSLRHALVFCAVMLRRAQCLRGVVADVTGARRAS